ncbi:hypothetical protein BDA99DRAFT_540033 [Phascolomyces articulosus]|uniref:Pentacotripeptide-repeat region of PRORP domain-containing protein n=1 Tax=Phascolomyces articulosus TaxID=60185 RepID=A0AAD5K4Q1_9FUNG|nr:hypothetical protein BDA99DRAFT_540033 [Phascolomyces articulosus]
MVHWHCGRLHSATRQQTHRHLLQQWQLFLLNELEYLSIKTTNTTTRLPVSTTTTAPVRRAFSSCSCRAEHKPMSQPLETTETKIRSAWEKRNSQRRIPPHISAKFDTHILPPQSMSSAITIRSHLENGDRTRALEAFEAIAHLPPREYGIPRVIAQQLLACLRADIRAEGHYHYHNHHRHTATHTKNNNNSSKKHRHPPSHGYYYFRAQQLQQRYHRQLELLLTHVRSLGYFWDDNEFRVILELFDRMDLVERAEVIFRNRELYCDQPITIFTYNKLAAAYLRRIKQLDHDKREQMRYMDKLESLIKSATTKHGLKLDVVTFNLLLSARARVFMEGGVVIPELHRRGGAGSSLQAAVETTFQEMEKEGIKPNDRTLNIALDIYGKLEMDPLLLQGNKEMNHMLATLLKSMEKEQGQEGYGGPDVVTYTTTIRNAVLQRDMRTAEKTFRAMVEKGVMPNEFVFSHLVVGYVQLGDMEKAHAIIRLMQKSPFGLRPTVHVFTPIIQGYAKSFEYDKAYSIFSEMVDQGIPANLTTYTILATMFVDSPIHENPVQAIHILRGLSKMSSSSDQTSPSVDVEEVLDQAALTVLIEAHGLAGARDLDPITKNNNNNGGDNHNNSSSNINNGKRQQPKSEDLLSRRELHAQAAKECYETIVRHYNKPDHLAHTALLTAYARLDLPEKAWEFWQQLKQSETPLTTIHYNALFMALANIRYWFPTVKKTFDEMIHHTNSYGSTLVPDVATYDLLIRGAFEANDFDWVRSLWQLPSRPRGDNNQRPNEDGSYLLVRTYYYALYSMVAAEDLHGAQEIFKEFKKLPHSPASATIWSQRIHKLAYQRFSSKLE